MDHPLTPQEREKYDIIRACIDSDLTNAEAAIRLGITIRQIRRLKRAVERGGTPAVVHGGKGKRSNRATDEKTIGGIVSFLEKTNHRDFGPTFAMEQLAKQKNIVLSAETVRTLMINRSLWKGRKRRGPAIHRAWRERMAMYGELVQFDGSYHDWNEDDDEECLLASIDDATGAVPHAVFDDNEGVQAVFRFWWRYVEEKGRPVAVYLDKFSTYKINHKNAVDNEELMTQFERAMEELGIRLIKANSPEAKGRVERLFGTLQDRLVKEMRLAGARTREEMNRFLAGYLPAHNARFGVEARVAGDAHRPLSHEQRRRLPAIFSIQSTRRVNNDFTVQFKNRWYQLDATQRTTVYKGDVMIVEERLDGTLHFRLKDTYLAYTTLPTRPKPTRLHVTALTREKPHWTPPANHPWRRDFLKKSRAASHKSDNAS